MSLYRLEELFPVALQARLEQCPASSCIMPPAGTPRANCGILPANRAGRGQGAALWRSVGQRRSWPIVPGTGRGLRDSYVLCPSPWSVIAAPFRTREDVLSLMKNAEIALR